MSVTDSATITKRKQITAQKMIELVELMKHTNPQGPWFKDDSHSTERMAELTEFCELMEATQQDKGLTFNQVMDLIIQTHGDFDRVYPLARVEINTLINDIRYY